LDCSSTVVVVSVTPVHWPSEISWNVKDASGTEMCDSAAMGALLEGVPAYSECCLPDATYTIHCYDSYGDGWNGAFLTFGNAEKCTGFDNGNALDDTLTVGQNGDDVVHASCSDVELSLTPGSYPEEISWTITFDCNSHYLSEVLVTDVETTYACCLPAGYHEVVCNDAWGDGWGGAVFTVAGTSVCESFSSGNVMTDSITVTASEKQTATESKVSQTREVPRRTREVKESSARERTLADEVEPMPVSIPVYVFAVIGAITVLYYIYISLRERYCKAYEFERVDDITECDEL